MGSVRPRSTSTPPSGTSGSKEPTVITGDFNNGKVFEKGKPRDWRHVVARYEEVGLVSAYHSFFNEAPGEETHPTHWWTRNADRPFHIDYCFVPNNWDITQVWVGHHTDWLRKGDGSDHAPMVVDAIVPKPADSEKN